ncbi:MAG: AAA family ATPase [Solobacterium sp.]|nr:AAA family ATPase [Solobacterium sp.]
MTEMMTVKMAGQKWQLTARRITVLCKEGRIPGAVMEGHQWLIPADAGKPEDKRIRKVPLQDAGSILLPLPVGVVSYKEAVSKYYYVDKTLMIRDIIDQLPKVSLFTRPRRFGKTLNMDMLRTYFEMSDQDNSVYFHDKKIWRCGRKYREEQGKYPVIYLTFKDMKTTSWQDALKKIRSLLAYEFIRHQELADSSKCNAVDREYYQTIIRKQASEVDMMDALLVLSRMLTDYHGTAPIIMIDEYDVPLQEAYLRGFYEEAILFIRNLFSAGLKDNPYYSLGFLTGILRATQESIFSGLNNLSVYSVFDDEFSQYFGFTHEEVKQMAAYYGFEDRYPYLCEWYDGYTFGSLEIFNPWSIVNCIRSRSLSAYWVSTSANEIIKDLLKNPAPDLFENLVSLLKGEEVWAYINTNIVYPHIADSPSAIYSFLMMTGYLKPISVEVLTNGGYTCRVSLPNKEVSAIFKEDIIKNTVNTVSESASLAIQKALPASDAAALQMNLEKLLKHSASYFDTSKEAFYHGLMLGLTAMMDTYYDVKSNRESGDGCYDLQLEPKRADLPGILIELKSGKDLSDEQLSQLVSEAQQQIDEKAYDTDLLAKGVQKILKYGVAFCGKKAEAVVRVQMSPERS